MVGAALLLVVALAALPSPAAAAPARDATNGLRLDQVQMLATHNSYHLRPGVGVEPGSDYAHPPLRVQLSELGLRSFELDAFAAPNFPVLHTPIVDEATSCATLAGCFGTLQSWSRAHPNHVPIVVLVEPKDYPRSDNSLFQPLLDREASRLGIADWDAAALDRLDAVVRSAFRKSLLTPDAVRGKALTLRDRIVQRGWPKLANVRGTVLVVLNESAAVRSMYLDGRPSLEGRAMFVTANPESPSAAVVKRDEPNVAMIQGLTRQHFLVRTRADADGVEARAHDLNRATAALASGAQIVSTDYPARDPKVGDYVVALPNGRTVRCNPVTAPPRCRDGTVEPRRA